MKNNRPTSLNSVLSSNITTRFGLQLDCVIYLKQRLRLVCVSWYGIVVLDKQWHGIIQILLLFDLVIPCEYALK